MLLMMSVMWVYYALYLLTRRLALLMWIVKLELWCCHHVVPCMMQSEECAEALILALRPYMVPHGAIHYVPSIMHEARVRINSREV